MIQKIFNIDDSPQKVAIGFGLGVFFGVMPAMGPIASVFFAAILRVNKAAALAGSILTNTWLSIPAFVSAAAIGSFITNLSYKDIMNTWSVLCKNFTWQALFTFSFYDILYPVITGYVIVSSVLAFLAYTVTLAILSSIKRGKSGRRIQKMEVK